MKLACIGPLSPSRTGVANFSERLLPYLAKGCKITLFTDGRVPSPPIFREFKYGDISEFISVPSDFDAAFYHMGNHHRFHRRVFEALCRIPGIVMLHDCVLNHFFGKYCLEAGKFELFRRLFKICYPDHADTEVQPFFKAMGDPYKYPMAGVVALFSRGTIVMSDYGRGIVEREAPGADVMKINFPYFPMEQTSLSQRSLRAMFDIPADSFVITSIGHITPAKRLDVAADAFRKLRHEFPNAVFLIAGEESPRLHLAELSQFDGLQNVKYLGFLDRERLDDLVTITDVCMNLRYPSTGEMSSTLIEMLGRGKVVAVSNYAQFGEFPDAACVKVTPGPNESDELAEKLLELARSPEKRSMIGDAAKSHIAQEHSATDIGARILKYIERRASGSPVLRWDEPNPLSTSEGAALRAKQMFSYNVRRFLSYVSEQGTARTLREVVRRVSSKAV